MNANKAVEEITYVYGVDVKTMGKGELLQAIKRSKTEITSLTEANVESTYIDKEVKRLNKAIKLMVKELDS